MDFLICVITYISDNFSNLSTIGEKRSRDVLARSWYVAPPMGLEGKRPKGGGIGVSGSGSIPTSLSASSCASSALLGRRLVCAPLDLDPDPPLPAPEPLHALLGRDHESVGSSASRPGATRC